MYADAAVSKRSAIKSFSSSDTSRAGAGQMLAGGLGLLALALLLAGARSGLIEGLGVVHAVSAATLPRQGRVCFVAMAKSAKRA